jgi:hypothetical protein
MEYTFPNPEVGLYPSFVPQNIDQIIVFKLKKNKKALFLSDKNLFRLGDKF